MRRKRQQNGITLILAVLIMSAVVAIGVTLSTVVIFQVRLNQVTAESHQGYYQAESGIELGLAAANQQKGTELTSAATTIAGLQLPTVSTSQYFTTTPALSMLSKTIPTSSGASVPPQLVVGQSAYLEMYDVTNSTTQLDNSAGGPSLVITGSGLTDAAGFVDTGEVLEVSWVAWTDKLEVSAPQKFYLSDYDLTHSTPVPVSAFYPTFSRTGNIAGYRFRLTPVPPPTSSSSTGTVAITSVAMTPTPVSQLMLKSVSSIGSNSQALVATFPWTSPLSALFDFVIFGESAIAKRIPVTIAQQLQTFGPIAAQEGTSPIPTSPTNPFTNCASTPCKYYIRLMSVAGWTGAVADTVNTSGSGSSQSIYTNTTTSCILRQTYSFGLGPWNIIFTNLPVGITSYELLSQPSFYGPQETYCPTS